MAHGGDPEEVGAHLISRPIPNEALATSPTTGYANFIIASCPTKGGEVLMIESIDATSYQAVADGTDAVTLAIKVVDNAGGAVSTPVAAFDLTTCTAKVTKNVYQGAPLSLTEGQSLLGEITVTTPDTAGFGYELSVAAKRLKV